MGSGNKSLLRGWYSINNCYDPNTGNNNLKKVCTMVRSDWLSQGDHFVAGFRFMM